MTESIKWLTGTPRSPGWYIVALQYKDTIINTIGCATWDGKIGWDIAEGDNVIAYIPLDNILALNKISWPEDL